jgi:hypothetical protein
MRGSRRLHIVRLEESQGVGTASLDQPQPRRQEKAWKASCDAQPLGLGGPVGDRQMPPSSAKVASHVVVFDLRITHAAFPCRSWRRA